MQLVQLLVFTASAFAADVRGVAPKDQHLYVPDSDGFFHCLSDPSIKISMDKVNDDYCDCPDGSDEPGTSACNNGKFYCVGSQQYIPSRLLNDSACDYDYCCDGSDEAPGLCEDKCAEVRAKQEAERQRKLEFLREGSRLRDLMVQEAVNRRKELKQSVEDLGVRIKSQEKEVEDLRNQLDVAREHQNQKLAESDASIALQKVRESLQGADEKLENYRSRLEEYREAYKVMEEALAKMSRDYNPNFNDPAVKEAIKKWASMHKPNLHISDYQKYSNDELLESIEGSLGDEELTCSAWSCAAGLIQVPMEIISTLLKGSVPNVSDIFSRTRSGGGNNALKVRRLTESYENANKALQESINTLTIDKKLLQLDSNFWGSDFIGHSAENLCVSFKKADFTYEACLFGTAVQINGKNNVQLGLTTGLKRSDEGTYYIDFKDGNPCPNGVKRSLRLQLECGHHTEAFFVEEPEVCHYLLKATSPIACDPIKEEIIHDEL